MKRLKKDPVKESKERIIYGLLYFFITSFLIKTVFGFMSDSKTLLVCGVFSLFGVLSAVVTLMRIGMAYPSKSFDRGKLESIVMFGIAIIIAISTVVLTFSLGHMVFFHTLFPPQLWAAWVAAGTAAGSLGFMEWMGTQIDRVPEGEQNDISFVLQTDFIFSILTVAAVVFSRMGVYVLDYACAIFASFFIIAYSAQFLRRAFKGLMEVPTEQQVLHKILTDKKLTSCGKDCLDCSKVVLAWTIIGNSFLVVLKLIGGVFANSSGLIADGIQSISCVMTSIMVMVTVSLTHQPNDEHFPYGYAKLEVFTTLIAFSVLLGIGAFIILSSILAILKHDFLQPDIMALPIAAISIFITYMIQRHNFCAGKKLDSTAMIANGCHAGADVLSSSAVIGGIILSQWGPNFAVCDKLAALLVGIIIVKDSLGHWMTSIRNILDVSPLKGGV